ncbi:Plasmodium variant antigen protein Cir/Yir/Bir, putative [Plasmodium ovale]|uniref:Plasmodium variant antigen protein Cir/Yir/Bir, putative n=1 Tax=Plasmodium ovale TaxID=36330 RepID=A0A1C3KI06_PLAOA|nr:Plasmodium variant antigen protein Cir/Yir/Bir, putative [Plasmodium ovale]
MMKMYYNFCNEMDNYIRNDTWIENLWANYQYTSKCVFTETEFPEKRTQYETICAKFKCLYDLLFNELSGFSYMSKGPHIYINFWLNYQLKKIDSSSDSVQKFYKVLTSSDPSFDIYRKLQGKIQNIQDEHLENMTIFYNLYHKYNAIQSLIQDYTSDHTQCASYSKECAQEYEEAIKRCPRDTSSNFCEALNVFKGKYEKLKGLIKINNCKLEELKPLPSHESLQQEGPPLPGEHPGTAELDHVLGEQGDTTDYSSAAAASGTMIGMLFISLILYKKNMIGKNIEEEEKNHQLLLHMSEYQDINSEDSIYKIPYTSL